MGARRGHQGGTRFWVAAVGATLAVALVPASAVAAQPASFSSASVYGAHTTPSAIAVLDVKGDGRQDIAVANSQSNDITVLIGDGAGAFTPLGDLIGLHAPSALTVGDFNEDGFQDIAAANQNSSGSNGVTIELGSSGGFGASTSASAHLNPVAIAAGDFNGDGHQDLAVGNGNSSDVSVLLGSGTGTFSAPTNFAVHASPASIAVGDFDRDGHEDLAVANTGNFSTASTDDVSVLLGTGTGSFGAATNFGAGQRPVAVVAGDFNEDGKQDLAVGNGNGGDASVLIGAGNGSFGSATSSPGGNLMTGLVVGDFNGDGHQDLAMSNFNGADAGVTVLLGAGTGTFSGAAPFSTNAFSPVGLAVGDFNGDGRDDLTAAGHNQSNGTASVLLNTAHFPAVSQISSPSAPSIGLPEDVAVSPEKSGSVSNVYVGSPSGLLAFSRNPATGALTQIAAPSSPRGLANAVDGNVTVSPDGKSVYLATGHAVLVFSRDTSTGALTQLAGTAGCINSDGTDGCATSRSAGSFVPDLVRFGPEASASTAYVLGPPHNTGTVLSIFARDTTTGALTQAPTAAGCISSTGLDGNGGTCQTVPELGNEADIAFTADGSRAYVASSSEATIVAFARDNSGGLTPLSGTARCVVDADSASSWPGCKPGRALGGLEREALVGDNLYVTNSNGTDHGVAEFAISPATGGLSQLPGANGCLTTTGDDGETTHGACTRARVTSGAGDLGGPREIVASPDGLDVYVVGEDNGDLVTLARDLSSGALRDIACVGDNSADPGCTQGSGMSNLSGLAISPDGRNLYGAADGVSSFTRRAPGFTVTGSASPAAGGTVAGATSSPNSSCSGSSCTVDSGGSATLTATAASGYRFTGWSGACSGTTNPCTIDNVTSDRSATANFVARVTVTGTPDPAAGGSITASDSSPSASCAGASCTVDSGDTVTLTAATASGYRFTGWHGPCGGGGSSGLTCTVSNATSDTGATAGFVRRVTVTGTASPATSGFVHASSPSPNATCDNPVSGACTLDSGDGVTFTATAASGHTFKSWSGACSGTTPTCTISHATSDLTATANFGTEAAAGTTSTSGSSTITVPPKGTFKTGITVACGKPCELAAEAKTTVPGKKKASATAAAAKTTLTVATFKRKLGAGMHLKLVMRLNHKGLKLIRRLHRLVVRVNVRISALNKRTVKTHRTLKLKLAKHH